MLTINVDNIYKVDQEFELDDNELQAELYNKYNISNWISSGPVAFFFLEYAFEKFYIKGIKAYIYEISYKFYAIFLIIGIIKNYQLAGKISIKSKAFYLMNCIYIATM